MKLLIAIVGLALAGCAAAPEPNPTTLPTTKGEPFHAEGTYFLEPTNSDQRGVHEIVFLANASGMRVTAALQVGSSYVVGAPTTIADVQAELFDSAGTSLAKAARAAGGSTQLKLVGENASAGEGKLVLRYYGGSGGGQGDFVKFVLDAASP